VEKATKVLILDDEPVVGERLKATLEKAGFAVDTCTTSSSALAMIKEHHYDVLVTDLKMSGPDGMDVLRAAKEALPRIKPVVITGFATKDTAEEAMSSGAVAFIPKPFKMSQLRDLLKRLVTEDRESMSGE
jgi:DNA-binding NtrC family response regulator